MDKKTGYSAALLDSFVVHLNEIGAVKIDTEGGFTLKLHEQNPDAPLSPLYFNLRLADNKQGPLTFHEIEQMAEFMFGYVIDRKIAFDGICGIPRAGEPFAEELQKLYFYRLGKDIPRITLDKYEGDKVRRIGGVTNANELKPGAKVLLLDDLVTRADSKFEAIDRLREAGFVVDNCVVYLDREQGGSRQMIDKGVALHSIVGLASVLEILKDNERITSAQYKHIHAYLKKAA